MYSSEMSMNLKVMRGASALQIKEAMNYSAHLIPSGTGTTEAWTPALISMTVAPEKIESDSKNESTDGGDVLSVQR
jgi:hypothetical protein